MALRSYFHVCRQGLAADRPATPSGDWLYFATDTLVMSVYDSGAVAWRDYPAIFTLPLSIANGGTGQTTQTAAFDALSPDTTKGDLIVNDGTNSVRLAVASNDYSTIIARAGATPGLEWRDRTELVTIFAHPTQVPWTPGAAYAPFQSSSSECSLTRSFKPYREARIIVRGKLTIGSTQVDVKIVDTTNSQNMTGIVSFTSTTISTMVGTWTALNSATYAGDAAFEAQAIETVAGDSLRVNMIALELR